jgi:hypothetical protein
MPVNQRKITKEFCEGTMARGGRLFFPVNNKEDAEKIQSFLFELGYGWYSGGCNLQEITLNGDYIYLDTDKTLMQGAYSEGSESWLCTVQQLDPKTLSAEHEVMMEEIRKMRDGFQQEIAGLKAEILALRNDINPPMEKKAQLPSAKNNRPSSEGPAGAPV